MDAAAAARAAQLETIIEEPAESVDEPPEPSGHVRNLASDSAGAHAVA